MDLQSVFSDDQLAVMGCFVALMVCGAIAGLGYQFGPAGRKNTRKSSESSIRTIRPATPAPLESEETRRAA